MFLFIFSHTTCSYKWRKSVTLNSECGEVDIQINKYGKGYIIEQRFHGNNFIVNTDSLKVDISSRGNYYSGMGIQIEENSSFHLEKEAVIQSGEKLITKFYFEIPDNKTLRLLRHRDFLYILPGKYITCNGEAVITDTLVVNLYPSKNWLQEK